MSGGEIASLIGAVGILLTGLVAALRIRGDTGQGIVVAATGLAESQTKWTAWIEAQADDLRAVNTSLSDQLRALQNDLATLTVRTEAAMIGLRAELVEMTSQRDTAVAMATEMRGEVGRLNERVQLLERELAQYKRSNGA